MLKLIRAYSAPDAPAWVTGERCQATPLIGDLDRFVPKTEGSVLRVRQLIPPLTLRRPDGATVQAWDFKQRQNLVIAFLDVGCSRCESFVRDLADHVADLREKEAITLLVFPEQLEKLTTDLLPEGMFAGIAPSADEIREFLGGGALSGQLRSRRGIFVTDRYGEIAGLWIVREHDFPGIDQVLGALDSVEIACEECGVPIWPVDE